MSIFEHPLYAKSPIWIQERIIGARARVRRSIREGRRFRRTQEEVGATQWYDPAALEELAWERFRRVLAHASRYVEYYRDLAAAHRLDASHVRDRRDIERLPLLDKAAVMRLGSRLIASDYRGPQVPINTSGSTGSPLQLLQTVEAVVWENAFVWRQLAWAGYRRGEPRAWIRGDLVVPYVQSTPPYWRLNRAEHMLMMSSYHLAPATVAAYVEALERFDPIVIQAYPSSIAFIARYLSSAGREYRGRRLRSVVTSSETLTPADRRAIEGAFGCRVFDYYGSAERVALIQTCEHGTYHVASDYSLFELQPREGGLYEIVGTGFFNRLMPLIRYRTGDLVEPEDAARACACGRAFPIMKRVIGRTDDYVVTPDGRLVGRLDHVFKGVSGIAAAQIVQESVNEIVIRVVPYQNFAPEHRQRLVEQTQQRVGSGMRVHVDLVDDIPRGPNGKFRAVVCKVPLPAEAAAPASTIQ
ncbi:MAG TPA: phenylacetate--CoA ligase family protein [Burkholderiales bacterium]